MKRAVLLLVPTLILLLAWSAAPTRGAEEDEPKRPGITTVQPGEKIKDIKSDPFKMGKVTIEDDVLKIKVSYSGGAEEHDFKLYWNQIVLESFPPQTTLHLKHDANGDSAEAYLTETVEFDLIAIDKPMIITIVDDHGGKAKVEYGER